MIVQNFRAKPNTKQASAPEPDLDDLLWTIAAARLILQDDADGSVIAQPLEIELGATMPDAEAAVVEARECVAVDADIGRDRLGARPEDRERRLGVELVRLDPREPDVGDGPLNIWQTRTV